MSITQVQQYIIDESMEAPDSGDGDYHHSDWDEVDDQIDPDAEMSYEQFQAELVADLEAQMTGNPADPSDLGWSDQF